MCPSNKDFNRLLNDFVIEELKNGGKVPEPILEYFSSDYVCLPFESSSYESQDWNNFIARFEDYIYKQNDGIDGSERFNFGIMEHKYEHSFNRCLRLCDDRNSYRKQRTDVAVAVYKAFNRTHERRNQEIKTVTNQVEMENLSFQLLHTKFQILNLKAKSRPIKENPALFIALTKLKSLLESELRDCNKVLQEAEDLYARYKDVQDDTEYLDLLNKYKKLLRRKHMLVLSY